MKIIRSHQLFILLFLILTFGLVYAQVHSINGELDTSKIEQLTGIKGKMDSTEHVFKISAPRTDLKVNVAGVKMTPPMGFTSWAAFQQAGDQVMVMGDLVLLENQVNPVMSVVLDNGIEVTALHNHFLWDNPKVMFMHIGGMGEIQKLASGVGKIFEALKQTNNMAQRKRKFVSIGKTSLDPKVIESIVGTPVESVGGVYKLAIGRSTTMQGFEAGKSMGVNTWAAFVGSDNNAVVDGDFAMLESELQGVLKALRKAGIFITAIHNHMVGETPKIVLLHYWGTGPVKELAQGLKSTLATQAKP